MIVEGTIAKVPAILDKVIFSAIKIDGYPDRKPVQLVLFRKNRPAELTKYLSNVSLGDSITIEAKGEKNPRTGEAQLVITNILNAESKHIEVPCPTVF